MSRRTDFQFIRTCCKNIISVTTPVRFITSGICGATDISAQQKHLAWSFRIPSVREDMILTYIFTLIISK